MEVTHDAGDWKLESIPEIFPGECVIKLNSLSGRRFVVLKKSTFRNNKSMLLFSSSKMKRANEKGDRKGKGREIGKQGYVTWWIFATTEILFGSI